jgi:hypothetical protein
VAFYGGFSFFDCPNRIPRWLHVEASKEPPISNSKIMELVFKKILSPMKLEFGVF